MIDLIQWRTSIGLWCGHYCISSRTTAHTTIDGIGSSNCHNRNDITLRTLSALLALFLSLLLIQSGDVELNPGPTIGNAGPSSIDDKPLLMERLNWQSFGIAYSHILYQITGLTILTVIMIMTCYWKTGRRLPNSQGQSSKSSVSPSPAVDLAANDSGDNPHSIAGNSLLSSRELLRTHSATLTNAISLNLFTVTNELCAKGLIPQETKIDMYSLTGENELKKAGKLVITLQTLLEVSTDPDQYLIDVCYALIRQHHQSLHTVINSILQQLGQPIPDGPTFTGLPNEVQRYADIMKQQYGQQPTVAIDWPPRVGQDYFGKLALVEKKDVSLQTEQQKHWLMMRGKVDRIAKLPGHKEITIENVLQPCSDTLSLRVVVDGPPGIGKTTLCHKLLNMWANEQLTHQHYDLVLYCPFRNIKIAHATTLADLFVYQRTEVPIVMEWFQKRNGKGLLLIFDGWDELSTELRKSSLAASIFRREQLHECSVIVTSRSYASFSLLKLIPLSKHVQVMGFSKKEVAAVIHRTLDENDPQLAKKLVRDLKVRSDVQSLCYIPLICSMVILVYCKSQQEFLPITLTELYENFILQTIRRHVEIRGTHSIEPTELYSLHHLPSVLATPLQEMCQLAYLSLKQDNRKMTFSSPQLQQSLNESIKENYLGLMTNYTDYDVKSYHFLHLSIQEFLAAWWIAKNKKTAEEVFKDHFDDDHFRMCLRFVAGLTHLQPHESYQQHFNKPLDLQCKRIPLFGFEALYSSQVYQNLISPDSNHCSRSDYFDLPPILHLQLLYESQNTKLCQVLAQSIKNQSLCYRQLPFISLFDRLCLSYFINNSNTTWNHLDLWWLNEEQLSIFTNGLTNNSLQNQCKRLEVRLHSITDETVHKLLQTSFLFNIQECYFVFQRGQYDSCLLLLEFLKLPLLKTLHLTMDEADMPTDDIYTTDYTERYFELEKCIEKKSTLQEFYIGGEDISSIITCVVRGIMRNKTITSFSLLFDEFSFFPPPLPDGTIEHLLKDNCTLQALKLNIPDRLLPSSLNIVEVNTPLTALEIGERSSKLLTSFLPYIKGLHCLILHKPLPLHLLFHSHPILWSLAIPLDTAESITELFTILQSNTTLKALHVKVLDKVTFNSHMYTSLQNMLTLNQTLQYLEIVTPLDHPIPSSYLSCLTTGLIHNTSLQKLNVPIPLQSTNNEQMKTLFNTISQKDSLTELQVYLTIDQLSYSDCSDKEKKQIMTQLFYEQVLPLVTNMLQSHTAIRLLRIQCRYVNNNSSQPNWIELVQQFYRAMFLHPSLEYIEMRTGIASYCETSYFLEEILKAFITKHRKQHEPLIVEITHDC